MANRLRRDNSYFLDRLRTEHRQVYDDFKAGKFKNATEAFRVAGLIKTKTALQKLEAAWNEASADERDSFKKMIGCTAPTSAAGTHPASGGGLVAGAPPSSPVTLSVSPVTHPVPRHGGIVAPAPVSTPNHLRPGRGQLTDQERAEVLEIMDRRRLKLGDVMREIGLKPLNASLGNALHQRRSLSTDLLDLLRPWIAKHRKP